MNADNSPNSRNSFGVIDCDAIIAAMPASARSLVAAIGYRSTIDLLRRFGGKRLYVPLLADKDSEIAAVIGRKASEALSSAMGGKQAHFPSMRSVELLLRDNAIRADFDAGFPTDELIDRYRLTDRHVRRLLGTVRQASGSIYRRRSRVGRHRPLPRPERGEAPSGPVNV